MFKHINREEATDFLLAYYFVEPKVAWIFWIAFSSFIAIADRVINGTEIVFSIISIVVLTTIFVACIFVDFVKRLKRVNDDREKYISKGENIPQWLVLRACNPWSE